MPFNGVVTEYDDNGYSSNASFTKSIPFGGGVVKAGPGRLLKVVVTTTFAGAGGFLALWDSPSAASGTPLLQIPTASGVAGAIFTVDLPALAGIFASNPGGTLTAGAVTIGYS